MPLKLNESDYEKLEAKTQIEKTIADIVFNDEDNPRIEPTKANPDAWSRFQKAKELANELADAGILTLILVEEENETSEITIDWNAVQTNKKIFSKVKEFVCCFSRAYIDGSAWVLQEKVYK